MRLTTVICIILELCCGLIADAQVLKSRHLLLLKTSIEKGDTSALKSFWKWVDGENTPLIESLPDDTNKAIVTFIWHGDNDIVNISVMGQDMMRLMNTDCWYYSVVMNKHIPAFYSFFITRKGREIEKVPDPLNKRRFIVPEEVKGVIPENLKERQSEWLSSSILLFSKNENEQWLMQMPSIPKGEVKYFSVDDHYYKKKRNIWIYTPPGYKNSGDPCKLLFCFDGLSYLNEIPAPTILDNLIASKKISPTVAVMVDNGDAKESSGDLDNHEVFAKYISSELMNWIQKNWNISRDPHDVTLCGYSRGGLGATYVAWKNPAIFGNVLSQSGAFWRGNEGSSDNGEWLTEQFSNSPKTDLKLYIEVGGEETRKTPNGKIFKEANERLYKVLQLKDYKVKYTEVNGARHDPVHWRYQFPEGLIYLQTK